MTLKHRRKFTRDFNLQVLAEIPAGKSVAQAAREHQLHPTLIGRWQKQHCQYSDRAFHYRRRASAPQQDLATELRDHIQRIALDWPCYGYRRIRAELHRQGITVNHKRILECSN